MIRWLYETLTGRAWTTTRSAAAEFGPPPGQVYARQLAAYSDAQLLAHGDQILAQLRTGTPHRQPDADRRRTHLADRAHARAEALTGSGARRGVRW